MTSLPCALRLSGAAVLAGLVLATAARAEGNRLLPFWGQPYPYGYAWERPEPLPPRIERCRGHRHIATGRCEVVLHARD